MKFGNLNYRRGVITYSLSPYEQNAYAGFFSHGFPSLMRRFREKVLVVGTPFVLCYLIVE
nr:ubiquinol-cytochrome c reductase, complex III subunit VII [Schistosoma japonicum]